MALTYLEVNDDEYDEYCGKQVWKIGSVLPVEGVLQSVELVALSEEEVEESDDCALELGTLLGSNCYWGETLPEDVLADVCSDEEGDTWAETITLLQELIQ